jgi:translation initiation factor IF-3
LKKDKENKKKQKQIALKELRIKPHIDEHDMNTKISQIKKFIEKEHKVKVSLRLLGREKAHADTAIKVLDEIASHFEEIAVIEKKYGREQVQKFIMLSPKVK